MRLPLIVLGLALAGCGGGAEEATVQESQIPLGMGKYRTVFIDVISQDGTQLEEAGSLKAALVGRLTMLSCFDSFVTGVEPRGADLKISVLLTGISGASSTERVLFGGLAGKPRVTVDVRLIDLRSGAPVGRFQVEGTSSDGAPTARTTAEAYENAGVGIAEYIHQHK